MTARLIQDHIDKLASLIGPDWHTADRTGFCSLAPKQT
jgi:hypothetical protein